MTQQPVAIRDTSYPAKTNKTTLTLSSSKYYVKSINYNNYTIRLVDPGIQESDCSSMPRYFLTTSNFTSSYDYNYRGDPYETFQDRIPSGTLPLFDHVVYMNCSNLVRDDHAYTDTASCIKLNSQGGHVYAIARDLTVRNLKHNDCHVEVVTAISFFGYNRSGVEPRNFYQKFSYSEIHRMLVDGFEVSWLSGPCQDLCGNPGDCSTIPRYYLYASNFTDSYNYSYKEDPFQTSQYRIISRKIDDPSPTLSIPMFQHVIYMNCSNHVRDDDPVYVDTASCINSGHLYAITGDMKVGNLTDDDCHVEIITAISFFGYNYSSEDWDIPNEKYSYSEIHRMLVGGFDVSWMSAPCQNLCGVRDCYLSETTLGFHLSCDGKNNFTFFYFLIIVYLHGFKYHFYN
jgi:hypothetical protein